MAKFSAILGFQPAPNPSSCPWRRPFQEGHLQVPFLPKIFHLCRNRGSAGVPIPDFWLGGMDTSYPGLIRRRHIQPALARKPRTTASACLSMPKSWKSGK